MKKYEKEKKVTALINEKLTKFFINCDMTIGELKDTPMAEFNFAMQEFVRRKWEYLKSAKDDEVIYYGHASDNLGYFITEGEIIEND